MSSSPRLRALAGFNAMLAWLVIGGLSFVPGAAAQPVSIESLTFSDELGGFTILGASGRGSIADPFVVVEKITGPEDAVLIIRGLSPALGNRIGSQHLVGFAMRKIVVNGTDSEWHLFDIELRQTLAHPSTYDDGLSFGQGSDIGRPFTSSAFAASVITDEPYDGVTFRDGAVKPGEQAAFNFVVTHTSPVSPIYLLQR